MNNMMQANHGDRERERERALSIYPNQWSVAVMVAVLVFIPLPCVFLLLAHLSDTPMANFQERTGPAQLSLSSLNLSSSPKLPSSINFEKLTWGLRGVRHGDTDGIMHVLDKHFPQPLTAQRHTHAGFGNAEASSPARHGISRRHGESLTDWLQRQESAFLLQQDQQVLLQQDQQVLQQRLSNLSGLPSEILLMIWTRLAFDSRWTLGSTLYKRFPGNLGLRRLNELLADSLGIRGPLPEWDDAPEVDADTAMFVAVKVLATLYAFLRDLRDPFDYAEKYTPTEKRWLAMDGMVDTHLYYEKFFPTVYLAWLNRRVHGVFSVLHDEAQARLFEEAMTRLKRNGIPIGPLFYKLRIFLGGYPRAISDRWMRNAGWSETLTLIDNLFFQRTIHAADSLFSPRRPSDLFLLIMLSGAATDPLLRQLIPETNPRIVVERDLTYSELYALSRVARTFYPFDFPLHWSSVRPAQQSVAGVTHELVNVVAFSLNIVAPVEGGPSRPQVEIFLSLWNVSLPVSTDARAPEVIQGFYRSAFGPHDYLILGRRAPVSFADRRLGYNRYAMGRVPVRMSLPLTNQPAWLNFNLAALQKEVMIPAISSALVSIDLLFPLSQEPHTNTPEGTFDDSTFRGWFLQEMRLGAGGELVAHDLAWLSSSERLQFGRLPLWSNQVGYDLDAGDADALHVNISAVLSDAPSKDTSRLKEAFLTNNAVTPWQKSMFADVYLPWASISLPAEPYYQKKLWALPSSPRVLYIEQSVVPGADEWSYSDSPLMKVSRTLLVDRTAEVATEQRFLDISGLFKENENIPIVAQQMMWLFRHLNALRPTTLLLFALRSPSKHGEPEPEQEEWEWEDEQTETGVHHSLWKDSSLEPLHGISAPIVRPRKNLATTVAQWRLHDDKLDATFVLLAQQLSGQPGLFKLFLPPQDYSLPLHRYQPGLEDLHERLKKARRALWNVIHDTDGAKVVQLKRALVEQIYSGAAVKVDLDKLMRGLGADFRKELTDETGWEKESWPVTVVKGPEHLELYMAESQA